MNVQVYTEAFYMSVVNKIRRSFTSYSVWKVWDGGECPVDNNTKGRVVRRCQTIDYVEKYYDASYIYVYDWKHIGEYDDIMFYQIKIPFWKMVTDFFRKVK